MDRFDRHPADDYDPDALGTFWQDRDRMAECLPRGGEDEWRLLRCPLCHKTLDARPTCAVCGDETDVERDGPDADGSCPRSGGSSVPATTRQGSSAPGWVPVSLSARQEPA